MTGLRRAVTIACVTALPLVGGAAGEGRPQAPATTAAPAAGKAAGLLYVVIKKGKLGLIDAAGREVVPPAYDALAGRRIAYRRHFAPIADVLYHWDLWIDPVDSDPITFSKDGRSGFVDRAGKAVVEARFDDMREFGEAVRLAPARSDRLWGYVDGGGQYRIDPKFHDAGPFVGRVAPVMVDGAWGLIGPDGTYLITAQFEARPQVILPDSSGDARIPFKKGGLWGFVDLRGQVVIPARFEALIRPIGFREGLANVDLAGKTGFINPSGEFVIEPRYDVASPFINGRAMVQSAGKCGYIDPQGAVVLPLQYEFCGRFEEDLARVRSGTRWGYVDRTGALVVPTTYDAADEMHEGLAVVELGGKSGYVDREGKQAIEMKFSGARSFSEGLAPVRVGRKWGYVDAAGSVVIEPQFDDARPFRGELALVEKRETIGYVDKNGKIVYSVAYEELAPPPP